MRAFGAQPKFETKLARACKHRGTPTCEVLAQHQAQCHMGRARLVDVTEPHAVGRIRANETRRSTGRRTRIDEIADLEAHQIRDACSRRVVASDRDRTHVAVAPDQQCATRFCGSAGGPLPTERRFGLRLALHGCPCFGVMTHPAEKAVVASAKAGRHVGCDLRRLDHDCAGAAKGIKQRCAAFGACEPARTQQNSGSHVLAQRRRTRVGAPATLVQAFSRQIERKRHPLTRRMHMHADARLPGLDVGSTARGIAQCIADRILDSQSAKVRVDDPRVSTAEFASKRDARAQMRGPVDRAQCRIERCIVSG